MINRYDRVGEEIKKGLSDVIRELKDPRISPMTTIITSDVTSDLMLCKVRVSVYDKDEQVRKDTVEALNHASGFIKACVRQGRFHRIQRSYIKGNQRGYGL